MSEEKVPMITTYHGRRIETLTREELITALAEAVEWQRTLIEGAQADRAMFGRIIKGLRQ
jgi:hypothetical protein